MKAEKCVLIGWDAPIVKRVKKYVEEGVMPNTKRMIDEGVWGENCLVPHPTITPPNWTTIVTGSWIGTHQIVCFNLLEEGQLEKTYPAFYKDDCKAEYIWDAAEKIGKKTILLNYPSTWPNAVKNGIQIGGGGLGINEYRLKGVPEFGIKVDISADICFTTEELPESYLIKIKDIEGWKNLPKGKEFKEAEIKIEFRWSDYISKEKPWYILLINSGNGYDKIGIYKEKDGKKPIALLEKGKWSEKIYTELNTDKGEKKVVFKIKLIELTPDGENLKVYFTPLCSLSGFTSPSDIEKEIEKLEGLPMPCSFFTSARLGWIDIETLSELIDLQNEYLGQCAKYLLKNKEWDLFFMHAHCPDHFYHPFINEIEKDKKVEEAEKKFYISLDKMLGEILESIDEEKTLIIITSDHGAVPTQKEYIETGFDVNKILEKNGLLTTEIDEATGKRKIVLEKTKAVGKLSCYVYINLKSKYSKGIVEDSEYEKIQEQIIKALYDYTDPKTGKKVVAFAFKKQDARIIGLYGERVGDVVYGLYPETPGEHGRQITTGEYGFGSMKGLFIAKGPNIKKGVIIERTIWLTDIVPTICYLLDIPVPKDCEGAVLYQIFQEPDFKIKEIETLKKNYERVKKAIEAEKHLTHNY
ncbi:MAG: alkaline phosphatase family protein [Candidatus Omnitrophica bacterium]|nr:alkaline phosphatase family protein [Candidatus Omnitrophota bacterium]MCM8802389.1 alkaline phosphatase family protein [Candidatus Omnitrophota bacterium]